jgi:hypothetical protein
MAATEYWKRWDKNRRETNSEYKKQCNERSRKWYHNNKSKAKAHATQWRKSNPFDFVCNHVKAQANLIAVPFDLTSEYLQEIWTGICPVFNTQIVIGYKRDQSDARHKMASLDRKIPHLGYIKGNVQWISYLANAMKQNATPEELKQFAMWILKST